MAHKVHAGLMKWRLSVQVGDLVTMYYSDWRGEWGIGIIVESGIEGFNKFLVHWSKLNISSWEGREMLVGVINESR